MPTTIRSEVGVREVEQVGCPPSPFLGNGVSPAGLLTLPCVCRVYSSPLDVMECRSLTLAGARESTWKIPIPGPGGPTPALFCSSLGAHLLPGDAPSIRGLPQQWGYRGADSWVLSVGLEWQFPKCIPRPGVGVLIMSLWSNEFGRPSRGQNQAGFLDHKTFQSFYDNVKT